MEMFICLNHQIQIIIGINKIILLSHLGIERDKEVAQKTEGIDVIVSGHTHELIEGIKEGEFTQKVYPLDNRTFYKAKKN